MMSRLVAARVQARGAVAVSVGRGSPSALIFASESESAVGVELPGARRYLVLADSCQFFMPGTSAAATVAGSSRPPAGTFPLRQEAERRRRLAGAQPSAQPGIEPLVVLEELVEALRRQRRDAVLHLAGVRLGRVGGNAEDLGEKEEEVGVTVRQGLGNVPAEPGEPHVAARLVLDEAELLESLDGARRRGRATPRRSAICDTCTTSCSRSSM